MFPIREWRFDQGRQEWIELHRSRFRIGERLMLDPYYEERFEEPPRPSLSRYKPGIAGGASPFTVRRHTPVRPRRPRRPLPH